MTAITLNGKALAKRLQAQLSEQISHYQQSHRAPGLAVLMVGDHPASATYVRNKEKACSQVGIQSFGQHFEASVTTQEVLAVIQQMNRDEAVDGILVQLPLPDHLDATQLLLAIDPDKDVDGLHPVNLGRLVRGQPGLQSCTPLGVMRILEEAPIPLAGMHSVVVGRSLLVGKPVSLMLLAANSTVTMAHSQTHDLAHITRQADVLVVAVGQPNTIHADMVKPGATVIDVGINRISSYDGPARLVGDVDYPAVKEVAGAITPVPGGVGPMTVTMLLQNTVLSYCRREGLSPLPCE